MPSSGADVFGEGKSLVAVQVKTHVSQRLFFLKPADFSVFYVLFHCFGSIESGSSETWRGVDTKVFVEDKDGYSRSI